MSYKIVSDTSCNIPMRLLEKAGVTLVPFSYYPKEDSADQRNCIDIDSFDGKAFYDGIREGNLYNTSQVTPQTFFDHIAPYAEEGFDVLFVSMSSGISGSYNSSLVAKEMLEDAYPNCKFFMLDTRAASLGEGIAVFEAIKNRDEKGMSIEENYEALSTLCDKIYQVFTVDSLRHLQRTGRLSNAAAIIGTVLNIKPLLRGNEFGQIINFDKVRGSRKALRAMADKYDELVEGAAEQTVYIAHSDNQEDADFLINLLNEKNPPKDVLSVCYEPVTGTHVGPGTVALFFVGGEDVRFH